MRAAGSGRGERASGASTDSEVAPGGFYLVADSERARG